MVFWIHGFGWFWLAGFGWEGVQVKGEGCAQVVDHSGCEEASSWCWCSPCWAS